MTGPGIGKIPLKAKVYVKYRSTPFELKNTDIYLHVKGYSLARVTHIDLENEYLNRIMRPKTHTYGKAIGLRDGFKVILFKPTGEVAAKEIILKIYEPELTVLKPYEETIVYVGGKDGGIFIGFKRNILDRLEEFAERRGYPPRRSTLLY